MMLLYAIGIKLYALGIFIASFFNSKAKAWVNGRKGIFQQLNEKLSADSSKKIWFHCSSYGEFEQGRPVLQQIKKEYPGYKMVLTFFSPSGYLHGFKEPAADYVFYLPMDGKANAHAFITALKPSLAIFVKYDFWFFYMQALHKQAIPFVFISSIFRTDQYFFKWFGRPFLRKLKQTSYFFVQNEMTRHLLSAHGIKNVTVSGDTRFDRVVQLPGCEFTDNKIQAFSGNAKVIIGGSTWKPDESLLIQYMRKNKGKVKLILVPHEVKNNAIEETMAHTYIKTIRYSTCKPDDVVNADVLIVDTVGMLSKIYRYGDIAFIGGGFGKGIHNTLEAAVYGIPVLFGPHFHKFDEAKGLQENGGSWSVANYSELEHQLNTLLFNAALLLEAGANNKKFVMKNSGATAKIMSVIEQFLQ